MIEDLRRCREAFEKWWMSTSHYQNYTVPSLETRYLLWEGWQAAWNTRTPSPSSVTLPREVVSILKEIKNGCGSSWVERRATEALSLLEKHMGENA